MAGRAAMAKLKQGEAGTRGTRRIARRQVKSALQKLARKTTSDRAVHSARKELKKARATLRLLRDALGRSTYKKENTALRDAARPLSEVRDGRVLLDALNSLVEYYGAPAAALPLANFKRALSRRRTQLRHKILEERGPLRTARKALRDIRSRSEKWHVGRHGWSVLGAGLKRTYVTGRSAFAQAMATPTDEHLHEWRKQTKYFANQLEMLLPLDRKHLDESHRHATQLADCLGDDHDLAIVTAQISKHAEGEHPEAHHAGARRLIRTVKGRRKKLQRRAMQLGHRLYAGHAARYRP